MSLINCKSEEFKSEELKEIIIYYRNQTIPFSDPTFWDDTIVKKYKNIFIVIFYYYRSFNDNEIENILSSDKPEHIKMKKYFKNENNKIKYIRRSYIIDIKKGVVLHSSSKKPKKVEKFTKYSNMTLDNYVVHQYKKLMNMLKKKKK